MSNTSCPVVPVTQGTIEKVKREAKKLRKQDPSRKLTECQNDVARKLTGFDSYKALLREVPRYTLQTSNRSIGMFRLKEDGSWSPVTELTAIEPGDRVFDSEDSMNAYLPFGSRTTIKEQVFQVDPTEYSFSDPFVVHRSVKTHFHSLPKHIPDIEQLREVVRGGNDEEHSYICLNDSGKFLVLHDKDMPFKSMKPTLVSVGETLIAHNGYVGKEAALDDSWINTNYKTGLGAWLDYLETGMSQLSESRYEHTPLDEIKANLKKLMN